VARRPLLGAASIPSAPVLVPGVGMGRGAVLEQLRTTVSRVIARLPDADVVVVVAAGQPALHDTVTVDLTGLGHPQVTRTLDGCPLAITALSRITQYPRVRRTRLPLDLAVLALLVDRRVPVVALEVSASAEFSVLSALGTSAVQALDDAGVTGVMVAAGDLSAGLNDAAPLAALPGAQRWDADVVGLFTRGVTEELADHGPVAAAAVGARGWAPLCVLHGAAASASLTLSVRRYSAPRGVGYLVTSTR
jgi:hypothetical protein